MAAAAAGAVFVSGVAQFEQNFAPGVAGVPQFGHVTANGVAHSWQNLAPTLLLRSTVGTDQAQSIPGSLPPDINDVY